MCWRVRDRAESVENLCHLGKGPAERGRAFGTRLPVLA